MCVLLCPSSHRFLLIINASAIILTRSVGPTISRNVIALTYFPADRVRRVIISFTYMSSRIHRGRVYYDRCAAVGPLSCHVAALLWCWCCSWFPPEPRVGFIMRRRKRNIVCPSIHPSIHRQIRVYIYALIRYYLTRSLFQFVRLCVLCCT